MQILKKKRILLLIFLIMISFYSTKVVYGKQSFPDTFADIEYVKYSFNQIFTHYEMGTSQAAGVISIKIQDLTESINFSIDHNLDIWPRSCYEAQKFNYQINYRVNPVTRQITYVDYYSSGFNGDGLKNQYCFYYMQDYTQVGQDKYILHDDMMIFRGTPFHSSLFHCVGVNNPADRIYIQGDFYDTIHMQFNVSNGDPIMIYTGSICGIGTGIYINASIDLYYDINSGVLLYSKSDYLEYYYANPAIQQRHQIQRMILQLDFEGETGTGFVDSQKPINYFWDDPTNRLGIQIIILIIIASLVSIIIINRRSIKWKYEAIRSINNIETNLKREINLIRTKIDEDLKELDKLQALLKSPQKSFDNYLDKENVNTKS